MTRQPRKRLVFSPSHTQSHFSSTQWDHYLSCSQLPLVTDERALNSWISEYRDAALSDIATTLEDIKNCLTVSPCTPEKSQFCLVLVSSFVAKWRELWREMGYQQHKLTREAITKM